MAEAVRSSHCEDRQTILQSQTENHQIRGRLRQTDFEVKRIGMKSTWETILSVRLSVSCTDISEIQEVNPPKTVEPPYSLNHGIKNNITFYILLSSNIVQLSHKMGDGSLFQYN